MITEADRLLHMYPLPHSHEQIQSLIDKANGDVNTVQIACIKMSEGASLDEAIKYVEEIAAKRAKR